MSQLCLVGRRAAISVLSFGNHLVAIVMADRCSRIEITKSTLLLEAIEIGDGNLREKLKEYRKTQTLNVMKDTLP